MFIKFILNKPYKHIIRGVKAMKKTNKEGIVQQSDTHTHTYFLILTTKINFI